MTRARLRRWGLRAPREWFADRDADVQLADGQMLRLGSIGASDLSFRLFWCGIQYYEPISTLVLQQLLAPGDTFLDVGANIGFYTLVLAATHQNLRIVAFEPNPEAYALLRQNVTANQFQEILCEPLALSDADGTGTLYLSETGPHSASLRSDFDEKPIGTTEVSIIRLDAYVQRIQLPSDGRLVIKIDVAGAEDAVLRGAWQTLAARKPDIIVEVAESRQSPVLAYLLKELGYRVYSITNTGLNEVSTWAPVVRGQLVFLNHLLSARPAEEVTEIFLRIENRVKWLDLSTTSKLAGASVRERAMPQDASP